MSSKVSRKFTKSDQKVIENAKMANKYTDEEILEILDDSDGGNLSDLLDSDVSSDDLEFDLEDDPNYVPEWVIPKHRIQTQKSGDTNPAQGNDDKDKTERKKKTKKKSNVKNIQDTLNPNNYDMYKIPSKATQCSVTVKTKPPRKIDWVNKPPTNANKKKAYHETKGPIGEPMGKAKDVKTPLECNII